MNFNRNGITLGRNINTPDQSDIENSPVLRRSSLDMAYKIGGELITNCLDKLDLIGKYKYVSVDTKVSYLMKGWSPSIPGWHTDGVPRGEELNPAGKGLPNIQAQEKMDSSIYHLLVAGLNPTLFINDRDIDLDVPLKPSRDLYSTISKQVESKKDLNTFQIKLNTFYTWDWWELHAAQWAKETGWRFLIRVTESDFVVPNTDLSEIYRKQNQVYVNSENIGW